MKTTKAQFNRFKKEFMRCVEVLGLKDWKIFFDHIDIGDNWGSIHCNYKGATATVSMSDTIEAVFKKDFVPESIAKHEAIHLMLYPLVYEGKARYTSPETLDEHWEHVTRVIEKIKF